MGQPKYVIINDTSEPQPNATNAPFIFISYSHKDNDLVYPIVHTLIENQVAVWLDPKLHGGIEWYIEVEKQLQHPHCKGVIFFISQNSMVSDAVMKELQMVSELIPDSRYFAVNLLYNEESGDSIGIDDYANALAITNAINKEKKDIYCRKFEKNKTYFGIRDPFCMDKIMATLQTWQEDGSAEVFPCSCVRHGSHIEYLPALIDLTPFAFTFFAASDQNRHIAESLNNTCKRRIHWKELPISDFISAEARARSLTDPCDGLILIVTDGNEDYLEKALTIRKYDYAHLPLLVIFAAGRTEDAAVMMKSAEGVIISWRERYGEIKGNKANDITQFLLTQTKERNKEQTKDEAAIRKMPNGERWRTLLSKGHYFRMIPEFYPAPYNLHSLTALTVQYPPFFEKKYDAEYESLISDTQAFSTEENIGFYL